MTMNQDQLKEYKTKLERGRIDNHGGDCAVMRSRLILVATSTMATKRAINRSRWGIKWRAARDLKDRLDEIDIALAKIQSGTYGVCEKCGKPIEYEILSIDPESRFCKECKTI